MPAYDLQAVVKLRVHRIHVADSFVELSHEFRRYRFVSQCFSPHAMQRIFQFLQYVIECFGRFVQHNLLKGVA